MLNGILIISVASIIAPLLILLGLKYGLIKYWTDNLIQDPINRQITPKTLEATTEITKDWISKYASRNDVQFVLPMIRAASSNVGIKIKGEGRTHLLDVVPTKDGDPLILENGGLIPKDGEGVLTKSAADRYQIKVGETIKVNISRKLNGKLQKSEQSIKIISVLSVRAGSIAKLYLPEQFVLDIETYKDGRAVPARAWDGVVAMPRTLMDGLYIVMETQLSDLDQNRLTIGTGYSYLDQIKADQFNQLYHTELSDNKFFYQLRVHKTPVNFKRYHQVKNKLRGRGAVIIPFVNDVSLVNAKNGETITFTALSLNASDAKKLGIDPLPWGGYRQGRVFTEISKLLLPTNSGENYTTLSAKLKNDKLISFPVDQVRSLQAASFIIPFELAAILRTGLESNIIYDNQAATFVKAKASYFGFRLYARTIDDVLQLEEDLREDGIFSNTEAESISRIKLIDSGLSKMFWLIAIVGILGGLTSLVASFFASVKRKEKDLGILRLIGVSSAQVSMFPLYQALIVSCSSVFLAISTFYLLAGIINGVFAAELPVGNNLCHLPISYLFVAAMITIGSSLLSSVSAAYQTTKIDPSEAIRSE